MVGTVIVRYFSKYLLTKAAARRIVGAQIVRRLSKLSIHSNYFFRRIHRISANSHKPIIIGMPICKTGTTHCVQIASEKELRTDETYGSGAGVAVGETM